MRFLPAAGICWYSVDIALEAERDRTRDELALTVGVRGLGGWNICDFAPESRGGAGSLGF